MRSDAGLQNLAHSTQDSPPVGFACQLDVEAADVQARQSGEEVGVIHVGAVGGVAVATGAGVNSAALAFRQAEVPGNPCDFVAASGEVQYCKDTRGVSRSCCTW